MIAWCRRNWPVVWVALFGAGLVAGCGLTDSDGGGAPVTPVAKTEPLVPAGDPAALERYLKKGLAQGFGRVLPPVPALSAVADAEVASGVASGVAARAAFSGTNVQESGVDEADSVKFDGRYLYLAEQPNIYYGWFDILPVRVAASVAQGTGILPPERPQAHIRVMDTTVQPPAATEVARIPLGDKGAGISGMYLWNRAGAGRADTLVAVGSGTPQAIGWPLWDDPWMWRNGRTVVRLFDVADPANATESWSLALEGHLIESRMVNGVVYLVTRHTPYIPGLIQWPATGAEARRNQARIARATVDDLLPKQVVNNRPEAPLVRATDCYLPQSTTDADGYPTLVTVTAIDLANPDGHRSVCLGAYTHGLYSSTEAVYLTGSTADKTVLHKFALTAQGPQYRGSGVVKGHLGWRNPRYRMSERNGVLRVMTTHRTFGEGVRIAHRLSLLREPQNGGAVLEEVAHLPNADRPEPIGKPGEDVYAVRYVGDRAYVVTFRRIDPLYVLDLADPAAPKIAGALEVPGFSDYLHPIGADLLVGIGRDVAVNDDRRPVPTGVKVALFDVADAGAPRLLDSVVIGTVGSHTNVSTDPHGLAYLPDPAGLAHRMALPVSVYDNGGKPPYLYGKWDHSGMYLFEIQPGGAGGDAALVPGGVLVAESATVDMPWPTDISRDRGVIQETALHYVHGDRVWSAPWADPTQATGPQ